GAGRGADERLLRDGGLRRVPRDDRPRVRERYRYVTREGRLDERRFGQRLDLDVAPPGEHVVRVKPQGHVDVGDELQPRRLSLVHDLDAAHRRPPTCSTIASSSSTARAPRW